MSPPIMMIPRAYTFTSEKKIRSGSPRNHNEQVSLNRTRSRKDEKKGDQKSKIAAENKSKETRREPSQPKILTSTAHSTPSRPVVIPTRTAPPTIEHQQSGLLHDEHDQHHDDKAASPSMEALLAMTSIPHYRVRGIKNAARDRLGPAGSHRSVSSTSPRSWSILQSPPDASDTDGDTDKDAYFDLDVGSLTSRDTLDVDRRDLQHSLSSDSIPSLDIETGILHSPDSPPLPRTPSSRRAKSPRREKVKLLSSSQPIAHGEFHPLALDDPAQNNAEHSDTTDDNSSSFDADSDSSSHGSPPQVASTPSQFRSNLTASLQRLKTAARSISLPTPSVASVLAINSRVLPDRKLPPRPRSPLPLNNSAFSSKTFCNLEREEKTERPRASDLYFSSTPSEEYRAIASSIQLQPYLRRGPDEDPLLDKATAPPVFLASTPAPPILLPGVDSPRPREPRENSDFLRVVVLEMNMRRAGKLGDVAGRAKIWIGPRSDSTSKQPEQEMVDASKVSRAERGMGEAVASELAEAMLIDGEEAKVMRSLNSDDAEDTFNPSKHSRTISKSVQQSTRGSIPSRWQSLHQ